MSPNKHYDVVIIGSGAGGGATAWALSRAGLKVLILEAGPRYDPHTDYKLDQANWESPFPIKQKPNRYTYGPMQKLADKHKHLRSWNHLSGLLTDSETRVSYGYHHVQGIGGSSLHFTGEAHRLNPEAMNMQSRFGVAADWPMSYEDLEPYYAQAEKVVGVAGPEPDQYRPRSTPYPQTGHPLSYASQHLKDGFNKLGLTLVPNSLAVLSTPENGRLNCNYCGGCLKGCPRTDKGSVDVTYLRYAEATGNCDIKPGCRVKYIESGEGDRLKGVHYEDNSGSHFIETPLLIVSCGAIESPRLLLASSSQHSPDGLANESGEVGKNFMETLLWSSNGLHPDLLGSHRGLPVDSICWDYNSPDSIPGVIGGCRFGPSQAESELVGPINYANRIVGGWGKSHKQQMRKQFGHALSITGICESLPNPQTFVTLDSEQKDASGMPVAQINSYIDDMAIKRIEFMANTCRNIMDAAGVSNIFEEFSSYDIFSSTHVFGTCRMGFNPDTSVVDPWCRSHRWKNLYIVDSSVFPSSGGGESPGLTIQALALRAAANILNT
ncbi:GMC family oxidoreductase [Methylophaga sp.]|uniref:GMC family oxidoreductase n=1 Tax=Methylophaga sp. TaxID=2024840 RepID=UPI003F6A5067